jgi:hypothetical protein
MLAIPRYPPDGFGTIDRLTGQRRCGRPDCGRVEARTLGFNDEHVAEGAGVSRRELSRIRLC